MSTTRKIRRAEKASAPSIWMRTNNIAFSSTAPRTALFSEWAMNTLSCTSRSEPVSRQLVRFSLERTDKKRRKPWRCGLQALFCIYRQESSCRANSFGSSGLSFFAFSARSYAQQVLDSAARKENSYSTKLSTEVTPKIDKSYAVKPF